MASMIVMRTYPIFDKTSGHTFAFEVDNIYLSSSSIIRLLTEIEGVTAVRKRKWLKSPADVHVEFEYLGRDYVVWEPYGDNSMYWIGPREPAPAPDILRIEDRFKSYRPPFLRQLLGDILSLRFLNASAKNRALTLTSDASRTTQASTVATAMTYSAR